MNFYTYNQENGKKYTIKSVKTKECSETGGRTREELARDLIKAYDGALKMAMGKIPRKGDIHEKIAEWKKIAEEMDDDE